MKWESVDQFGWNIPSERRKYYTQFVKKFHLIKWAQIDNNLLAMNLIKFMNGDPSYNAGLHVDHPHFIEFQPFMDHSLVFQGDKPWKRILTCGDYVDVDDELDFQDEFGKVYGLLSIYYPLEHWRNKSMVLSVFTTQRYIKYLVEKYNYAFSTSGSNRPVNALMVNGYHEAKLKKSIPELLKEVGYMYHPHFHVDISNVTNHPECPFSFLIEDQSHYEKQIKVIPDMYGQAVK